MIAENKGAMARPMVIAALTIYLGVVLATIFWPGGREQELRFALVGIAMFLVGLLLSVIGGWPTNVPS
jgi:fatty acid desaturase